MDDVDQNNTVQPETKLNGNKSHNLGPKREVPVMKDTEYMKLRVDTEIEWFDRKSSFNQQRYKKMKRWEFIIAASIPVVISLSAMSFFENISFWTRMVSIEGGATVAEKVFTLASLLQVFAALSGVALVIINKFLELDEYYKNWKEYRVTCETLQHERLKYLTQAEPYDEEEAYSIFVERIEGILNKEIQRWRKTPNAHQSKQVTEALNSLQKTYDKWQGKRPGEPEMNAEEDKNG
jgi:hypothetical protein